MAGRSVPSRHGTISPVPIKVANGASAFAWSVASSRVSADEGSTGPPYGRVGDLRVRSAPMETETGTEREADSVTGPVIDGGVGSDAVVVEATPVEPADVDAVEALLDQVDAALARLDDGSYGRCQSCGTIIADERL